MTTEPPPSAESAPGQLLPTAPPAVVADGTIPFGTYSGRIGSIDWSRLGLPARRLRRRHKRWHYVSVAGPEVVLAVAVVHVGWAGSAFAYLFDRTTRRLLADLEVVAPQARARVSPSPDAPASTTFRSRRLHVRLVATQRGRWRLEARSPGLTIDATLDETDAGPTMCALAPVAGGVADCTHKTPALRVEGVAGAMGAVFDLSSCHAALDHTDGLLARSTRWRWASATDSRIALNFTEDFTAPHENACWVDGRITALGPVRFEFDPARPESPWRIRSTSGDEVDLEFLPEGRRERHTSLLVASSRYVQPIGTFQGSVAGAEVRGLVGVTEDHAARW
ncbi:MAG TPA: DUF2804 domain-containing protein [Acidimicrobiales bacterium]|nr:DUF2804 domain-containing protein [Acidimicrobiales bacterium]